MPASVKRLSGSTINVVLTATRTGVPFSDMRRGITPRKPTILLLFSWYTREGRASSYQGLWKNASTPESFTPFGNVGNPLHIGVFVNSVRLWAGGKYCYGNLRDVILHHFAPYVWT